MMKTTHVLYVLLVVFLVAVLGGIAVNTDGITGLIGGDVIDVDTCNIRCEEICDTDECNRLCLRDVCQVKNTITGQTTAGVMK